MRVEIARKILVESREHIVSSLLSYVRIPGGKRNVKNSDVISALALRYDLRRKLRVYYAGKYL